jgi:hypothetical protein
MKEGCRNRRDSMKGPRGRALLLGIPKDMLRKARKWASASIGPPLLGNMEGRFLLRAFLFRGISYEVFKRCKMPCRWVSLSIGALVGNLEGVHLPG